jgi:protoporphyrinogen IX oxidase
MLWIKALHVFFVISWFAGLFYLPRIFVNLALVPEAGAERARLLLMAGKLYRFSKILAAGALLLGAWLWLGFGIGAGQAWLQAKLVLVLVLVVFQLACGHELRQLQSGRSGRSHRWFRWFNEVPTVLLLAIVALVVVKPI